MSSSSPTPSSSALVVLHVQDNLLSFLGPHRAGYEGQIHRAVTSARQRGLPIIWHTVDGTSPPIPNHFSQTMAGPMSSLPWTGAAVLPTAAAGYREGDLIIPNSDAYSPFQTHEKLKTSTVTHISLLGMATSIIVLCTVCASITQPYLVSVLSDGCADGDPDLHQTLLTKLFPKFVQVKTIEEFEQGK
jgi:nicotinamidase-related amidase